MCCVVHARMRSQEKYLRLTPCIKKEHTTRGALGTSIASSSRLSKKAPIPSWSCEDERTLQEACMRRREGVLLDVYRTHSIYKEYKELILMI
jgi:hypothetical protein